MERKHIAAEDFNSNVFDLLANGWMLLTAGEKDGGNFNTMTISWGMFGTLWGRPCVQVVVRPQRYTMEFLEKYDTFTLSAFPMEYRKALSYCGANSGRDGDKIAEAGLTVVDSEEVEAPTFAEANLVFECRKLYVDKFNGKNFLDKGIVKDCYPSRDYHVIFIAEVLRVEGTSEFRRNPNEG